MSGGGLFDSVYDSIIFKAMIYKAYGGKPELVTRHRGSSMLYYVPRLNKQAPKNVINEDAINHVTKFIGVGRMINDDDDDDD